MNSIRKDIEIVNGHAKEPLPMYESPWDNEYQWKGNLYQLDGWLSRITVSLAIPAEDTMMIYATDGRYIFKTVDGGKNWRDIGENFPAQPKKLACGKRIRMLYVAASDGFYKSISKKQVKSFGFRKVIDMTTRAMVETANKKRQIPCIIDKQIRNYRNSGGGLE